MSGAGLEWCARSAQRNQRRRPDGGVPCHDQGPLIDALEDFGAHDLVDGASGGDAALGEQNHAIRERKEEIHRRLCHLDLEVVLD